MDDEAISNEAKSWLENVLVPVLVREYLSEFLSEKKLAGSEMAVAECAPKSRMATSRGDK